MKIYYAFLTFLLIVSCSSNNFEDARNFINEKNLSAHIKKLSSDEFLGRSLGHEGEEKTINYLIEQYKRIGLEPADGKSYLQEINLVELTPLVNSEIIVKGKNGKVKLNYGDDFVAVTRRVTEEIQIKPCEIIFAGYGINAPEYNWNDFEGIDVKNKIILVMVNDPGFATNDSSLFKGKAMTYYGRWTYKYEEAARQGAAGVFVIHETKAASYPWEVVKNGRVGPQYFIEEKDKNFSRCKFEGWITYDKAKEIFNLAKLDLDEELKKASVRGFKAKPLGLTTSLTIKNKIEHIKTRNVLGILPGKERADEFVFYMAHWDHLGYDSSLKGDSIFNGARDNASGVAGILQIAEAFSKLKEKPKRSIAILSLTAEEQGLLGSEYYVKNPIIPLNKIIAAINLDGLNIFGRTKDIAVLGYGMSELDKYIKEEAEKLGKIVRPDPNPESGGFFRSDHYNFVKAGIPAIYIRHGIESIDGKKDIQKAAREWNKNNYHKVTDEFNHDWDLSGMVEEVQMLFDIGYKLSNENNFPKLIK
ncbi:MAG: M28 family metallopeptidase [Melioribacter sp.]|uniref:M28 family metallopeptidase n=1 Tax=Rosettibacter primus TaxID=3111523 RepID=UPI00247B9744|nr:M28 family metallopeptidase [Melioribacter sp.]